MSGRRYVAGLFENGKAYVNLHTAGFPGGEIRGQVVRK
ncbi:MAG: CHRD domain-containing protein [Polaromonas sp.]|nr:CHRD domain-containing protein [Gemmatimonadaceae bacterium]